jgi:hypothetical protein
MTKMTLNTKLTREALFAYWMERGLKHEDFAQSKDTVASILALMPELTMPAPGEFQALSSQQQEERKQHWRDELDRRLQAITVAAAVIIAETTPCVECMDGQLHYDTARSAYDALGDMLSNFLKATRHFIEGRPLRAKARKPSAIHVMTIPLGEDGIGAAIFEALRGLEDADSAPPVPPQRPPSPEAKDAAPGDPDRPLDGWAEGRGAAPAHAAPHRGVVEARTPTGTR